MENLNTWISGMAAYFLLISILDQLLPSRKYAKYIRLFCGMILIFLILSPVNRGLRLEERIAHAYESFVFENEADELKQELLGIEKQRLSEMIRQYELTIASNVEQMIEEESVEVVSCQVEICRDSESEQFGTIEKIRVLVKPSASGNDSWPIETDGICPQSEKGIEPITPVVIGAENIISRSAAEADDVKSLGLREKIASYYELEEAYVEIQIVEGER